MPQGTLGVFDHIERMEPYIRGRDWDGLERAYQRVCLQLAGDEQAKAIARVDLSRYQTALRDGLRRVVAMAKEQSAKAVYFEYDLDNDWQSSFFICQDYQPESEGDDDWASDWIDTVDGPDLPRFGAIYRENGFDRTDRAKGTTLYLIARTVAAFGRASAGADTETLALCIAYHDQDPVVRVHEPGS